MHDTYIHADCGYCKAVSDLTGQELAWLLANLDRFDATEIPRDMLVLRLDIERIRRELKL